MDNAKKYFCKQKKSPQWFLRHIKTLLLQLQNYVIFKAAYNGSLKAMVILSQLHDGMH